MGEERLRNKPKESHLFLKSNLTLHKLLSISFLLLSISSWCRSLYIRSTMWVGTSHWSKNLAFLSGETCLYISMYAFVELKWHQTLLYSLINWTWVFIAPHLHDCVYKNGQKCIMIIISKSNIINVFLPNWTFLEMKMDSWASTVLTLYYGSYVEMVPHGNRKQFLINYDYFYCQCSQGIKGR